MTKPQAAAAPAGLNVERYGRLLAKFAPKIIDTDAENEAAMEIAVQLMRKGDESRSPEEDAVLELLILLIEQFEARAYPVYEAAPRELSLLTQ